MTTDLTRRAALAGIAATAAAPALAQGGVTTTMMHGFRPGANVDIVARLTCFNVCRRPACSIWRSNRCSAPQ